MKTERRRIPLFLFADSVLRRSEDASRLFVLLHGYEQTGSRIFEKLDAVLPQDSVVLAPNGPFPMPRRTENGYQLGCSWYFYNPQTDQYFIDMEIGVEFVTRLVDQMGLGPLPTTLIGFSQGGFLAPFLASRLPQVDRVIGLGCEFLIDEMTLPVSFRMDAIHGALDEIVLPSDAQKAHARLKEAGVKGEFHLLSETGHRMDQAMRDKLADIL